METVIESEGHLTRTTAQDRTLRILITGADTTAAVGFMMLADRSVEFVAGASDPDAEGMGMVPPENRVVLPVGSHPTFFDAVRSACRTHRIDIVLPTLDDEILPLMDGQDALAREGVELICSPRRALEVCLDRQLAAHLTD